MKKLVMALALALLLAAPAVQATESAADNAVNTAAGKSPVEQFTGKYWVNSQPTNKEAYLYGLESAIEVEKLVNSRQVALAAKSGKKPDYTLSPFVQGWIKAFDGVPRKDIREEIDKWYAEHPDELSRPVLNVIWFELIEPRLKAVK